MSFHANKARELLAGYDRERVAPSDDPVAREKFLSRLLAEAQVHATLDVAEQLHWLKKEIEGRP